MSAAPPLTGKARVAQIINGQPVVIEVDGTNAPITAGNFVDLVERGIYDGVMFHRVKPDPSLPIVQAAEILAFQPVHWEPVILSIQIRIRVVLFPWKLNRKAQRNLFTTKL
jgi:Cyclophilin type peptidyl-prolyl cis-trans isomerase/CLD